MHKTEADSYEDSIFFILAKSAGMMLFFWTTKYMLDSEIAHFIFGRWFENLVAIYWPCVFGGLIPAVIARVKGESFWVWWGIGAFAPILSTIVAIGLDDKIAYSPKEESDTDMDDSKI